MPRVITGCGRDWSLNCLKTNILHTLGVCITMLMIRFPDISKLIDFSFTIKTHNNELRGQEEAGRMRLMSELFTGSTALILVL